MPAASDDLVQMAGELTDALAQASKRHQLSRERLIPTQYTSAAGQDNPAAQDNRLQWSGGAAAGQNQNPPSEVQNPQAAAQPAPAQATPVQPAPAYGQQMWPTQQTLPSGRSIRRKARTCPARSSARTRRSATARPTAASSPGRLPFTVGAEETMTGRLMFGVGVNSDAGLVGSIVLDEQNFDWTRFPNSWEDIRNATAWRGAGQRFRLEAVPGTQVSRYIGHLSKSRTCSTRRWPWA